MGPLTVLAFVPIFIFGYWDFQGGVYHCQAEASKHTSTCDAQSPMSNMGSRQSGKSRANKIPLRI